MLFRTVYGQELEVIYQLVRSQPDGLSRQQIVSAFVPTSHLTDTIVSSQNIDDALSFLISSYLMNEEEGVFKIVTLDYPFKLTLLRNLRLLELGVLPPIHPLDSLYMALLTECFILPDTLHMDNFHNRANSISSVKNQGGISKEKTQAWKRVMEYLGLGYRMQSGFLCVVAPELIRSILSVMTDDSTTLQIFFEQTFVHFLPYSNQSGDVSQAVGQPMLYLAQRGVIKLTALQDSPSKVYFRPENLRQITRENAYASA